MWSAHENTSINRNSFDSQRRAGERSGLNNRLSHYAEDPGFEGKILTNGRMIDNLPEIKHHIFVNRHAKAKAFFPFRGTAEVFAEVVASEPIEYDSVLCRCEEPFDTNGVLYHLGTGGGTREYENPHRSGEVVAALSSLSQMSGHEGDPEVVRERFVLHSLEHDRGNYKGLCYTDGEPNSWMSVDLGAGRSLVPDFYCLRGGNGVFHLRTWMLQGSQDGNEWHTLRVHENDESLGTTTHSVAGWAVEAGGRCHRHFRVLQHGKNSCDYDHLMCCGIELYGELSTH